MVGSSYNEINILYSYFYNDEKILKKNTIISLKNIGWDKNYIYFKVINNNNFLNYFELKDYKHNKEKIKKYSFIFKDKLCCYPKIENFSNLNSIIKNQNYLKELSQFEKIEENDYNAFIKYDLNTKENFNIIKNNFIKIKLDEKVELPKNILKILNENDEIVDYIKYIGKSLLDGSLIFSMSSKLNINNINNMIINENNFFIEIDDIKYKIKDISKSYMGEIQ